MKDIWVNFGPSTWYKKYNLGRNLKIAKILLATRKYIVIIFCFNGMKQHCDMNIQFCTD